MQLTKKEVVEQIKIIKEIQELFFDMRLKGALELHEVIDISRQGVNKCNDILAQLETDMQSVSERYIDIPIEQPTVNEDLIKEIEEAQARNILNNYTLNRCKTALSQVKPSNWQPIETIPDRTPVLISGFEWTAKGKVSKRRYFAVAKQLYEGVIADEDAYNEQGAEYTNITHWQPLPPAPTIGD